MKGVYSKNRVLIRITAERWNHIIENHIEMDSYYEQVLDTIADPDIIVEGFRDELVAANYINQKWLVVVYKELNNSDGFVITAFITTRLNYLLKKKIVWKKHS